MEPNLPADASPSPARSGDHQTASHPLEHLKDLLAIPGADIRDAVPYKNVESAPSRRESKDGERQKIWDREMLDLIAWFENARLPETAFDLYPWAKVTCPEKFYHGLRIDILAGPKGARARWGALQKNLRRLRELVAGTEQTTEA